MSRRNGQNPSVRIRKRADGKQVWYFQYYVDSPKGERERRTEVLGVVGEMGKSEANRRKIEVLQRLGVNSFDYQLPDSRTFGDAVEFYRNSFAPNELRDSTFDVAQCHIRVHLEPDWKDTPVEHITIDAVDSWARKKRREGISWTTIKNILRTMQRVLSCSSKDKRPPFSLQGLRIPAQDQLEMKLRRRKAPSFSWADALRLAAEVQKFRLDDGRKARYRMLFVLAAASGLRCSELFALRMDDIDFAARTIRVDESADRLGQIGRCKNVRAYRTVLLVDAEGGEALRTLKDFLGNRIQNSSELIFHSIRGAPIAATHVLHEALHPALKALGLPRGGMHAFRRGCNRRWELAGINPAVLRQQMGHSDSGMTRLYTGELSMAEVLAEFSGRIGPKIVVSENEEKAAAA